MKKKIIALIALLAAPLFARAQMATNGDPAVVADHGYTSFLANASSTGTTINLLGKTSASGAIIATTADTNIPTFVVVGGAGTTGNAQFALVGQALCVMDATNASGASGWYVLASTTTNGRCHAQSTAPTGWIVGRLVGDSTTSGSTATVLLSGTFNISGAGSGTVTSVATTSPIGGGTITTSGTITCTTCVTSAAVLADKAMVIGSGGGQGTQTVAGLTTDGVSILTLGVAGTSVGELDLKNATSGTIKIQPVTGALGTVTWSIPAATDTAVAKATTDTFTNKTLDAEGTGNVITVPFKLWLPAAGCNNATAGSFWDLPTSTPAVAACVTGTNIQKGVLQYADTSGGFSAQTTLILPSDFSGAIDARIIWRTSATTGNAKFTLSNVCTDVAATATDDPSFSNSNTVTTAAPGTTLRIQTSSITGLTTSGCAAGNLLHLKLFRDGNDASDTIAASLDVIGVEITTRRAM